jgi:hypothetical protein
MQAFREEFGPESGYVEYYPEFEDDLQRLTIGISSAPFYGALPPDADLSYEVCLVFSVPPSPPLLAKITVEIATR